MGVEEEMFLVDPDSGRLRAVSDRAMHAHRANDRAGDLDQELFLQQIETATRPHDDVDSLLADLRETRRTALVAARDAGAAVMIAPLPVIGEDVAETTPKDRYQQMIGEFAEVGRRGLTCGMHVHVDVASDEEAVGAADRVRPWLPVLAALSVNSPFHRDGDTGHASWRSRIWDGWPSAGPVEPFGDPAGYRAAIRALIESGAALDEAMAYFDVRLAASYPTLEVRVADVCTDLRDAVLIAVVARAMVDTAAHEWSDGIPVEPWRIEMLRGARWRAARFGLAGELLDPTTRRPAPAAEVLGSMIAWTADSLAATGDSALVEAGVERLLGEGTGAQRQRRVAGPDEDLRRVVEDLRLRTEESCA